MKLALEVSKARAIVFNRAVFEQVMHAVAWANKNPWLTTAAVYEAFVKPLLLVPGKAGSSSLQLSAKARKLIDSLFGAGYAARHEKAIAKELAGLPEELSTPFHDMCHVSGEDGLFIMADPPLRDALVASLLLARESSSKGHIHLRFALRFLHNGEVWKF